MNPNFSRLQFALLMLIGTSASPMICSAQRPTANTEEPNPDDPSVVIAAEIVDNPANSSLSKPVPGTTRVRFEDYVSNPPPSHRDPVQGWVAKFSVPFTGLVKPLATNTSLSPLPPPVGLLIESPADSIGFYDPSSQVDCADARADRLVFRFVAPANTRRAATVSRVAFRVTGTSVLYRKVRYTLFDIAGKKLASGLAKPNPTTGRAESEVECSALRDGKAHSVIHRRGNPDLSTCCRLESRAAVGGILHERVLRNAPRMALHRLRRYTHHAPELCRRGSAGPSY